MPRKETGDAFIDNIPEYWAWLARDDAWPHLELRGGVLAVVPQRIDEMSPQHAVSALHKSFRWFNWLWANDRFRAAGVTDDHAKLYQDHAGSALVHALAVRAVGSVVWDSSHESKPVLAYDQMFDVAIDVVVAWKDLEDSNLGPRPSTHAERVRALYGILRDTLSHYRKAASDVDE